MELKDFFEPVGNHIFSLASRQHPLVLANTVDIYREDRFPDITGAHIALIGVGEDRMADTNPGCAAAPDEVRKYFYGLFEGQGKAKIVDLGNIKPGNQVRDTYFAVSSVVEALIRNQTLPVIIGGSQDLTYANYQAYCQLGQIINMACIDPMFDIGIDKTQPAGHRNFLSAILTHQPNYLFNYTNIGYQSYFVDQDALDLMDKLLFDIHRLGMIRSNMEEAESAIRNADILSFDISSIRQSEAPGNLNSSPNGFYGEEACQIVRYAGLSDKLSSIGFYEINPALDVGGRTSHLVAQMIWYFIDGFKNRPNDFPDRQRKDSTEYIRYLVTIKEFQNELIFYKSKKSNRWWMEVPCSVGMEMKYERQFLVPCSYNDYLAACQDEVPDKWLQVYRKFL